MSQTLTRWAVIAVLLLAATSPARAQLSYPSGDFNGDGKVNIADVVAMLKAAAGLTTATGEQLSRADTNGDGKVSVADTLNVLKSVAGLKPPASQSLAVPACLDLACLMSTKGAQHIQAALPQRPSVTYTPGPLVNASGSFKKPTSAEAPCDPPVTLGPFMVASGGKLSASIDGEPAVPSVWSMGNWNSALHVYYEQMVGGEYRPGQEILVLAGQTTDNHLKGTAEWPSAGRITVVVTSPSGYGVFFGGCFDQGYSAKVDVTELYPNVPAQPGTGMKDGDKLSTAPSGQVTFVTPKGSVVGVDPNSLVSVTGVDGGTVDLPPSTTQEVEPYEAQLVKRLLEFWQHKPPLPLPQELEDRLNEIGLVSDEAFESAAKKYLQSFYGGEDSTLWGLIQQLKSESDPYEAAVVVKLTLDGSRGQWTVDKVLQALWDIKGPDGYDVTETVLELTKKLAYLAPPVGILGTLSDAKQVMDLVEQDYQTQQANAQYQAAEVLFSNSRSWSAERVQQEITNLQAQIGAQQDKIGQRQGDLMVSLSGVRAKYGYSDVYVEQVNRGWREPPGNWDAYAGECEPIIRQADMDVRGMVREAAGAGLKIQVLRKYRLGHTGSSLTFLQASPTLSNRVTRLSLETGSLRIVNGSPGRRDVQVLALGALITPQSGEFTCALEGESLRIRVLTGSVVVRPASGSPALVAAGTEYLLPSGARTTFDITQDKGGLVDGLPLRALSFDRAMPQSYGIYTLDARDNTVPAGWVWEDPLSDSVVKTPQAGMLEVTVPDNNEFWGNRADAPRLLHKVTGDFTLDAEVKLESQATDIAIAQYLLYSPASSRGYLDGQMDGGGLGAHYKLLGTAWNISGGANKLDVWGYPHNQGQDPPAGFVKTRLTRRGDLWRAYWSLDGQHWNLVDRQTNKVPDTLWVGMALKRYAWDRAWDKAAVVTLRNVKLVTGPTGALAQPEWDLVQLKGAVESAGTGALKLSLDGSVLGGVTAYTGQTYTGDFEAVVRYKLPAFEHKQGENRQVYLFANSADDKTGAYIRRWRGDSNPVDRYDTDNYNNNRYGWWQWAAPADTQGWFRIVRKEGVFHTYFWANCQWQRLDQFTSVYTGPVYLGVHLGNDEGAQTPVAVTADVSVERFTTSLSEMAAPWQPESCSAASVQPLPADLQLPQGATATLLSTPMTLGGFFIGDDGVANVLESVRYDTAPGSSVKYEGRLLKIRPEGAARIALSSPALYGINRKSAAQNGLNALVTVDYWPGGGNNLGSLEEVKPDGTYREWELSEPHGGLSDIVPAPQGGWYLSDFESDVLWYLAAEGQKGVRLITKGEVPPGLGPVAVDDQTKTVYVVNWTGDWPFGGLAAIYRITSDGAAELLAKAPDGSSFGGIAVSRGGAFGHALYASDSKGGRIVRVGEDGSLTPVVTGLTSPADIRFSPYNGDLGVVCNGTQFLWVRSGAPITPPPTGDGEVTATFTPGPTLVTGRMGALAAALPDGGAVLFGGHGAGFKALDTAEVLSLSTNRFTTLAMSGIHDGSAIARLADGRYLVAGGCSDLGVPSSKVAELFDPATLSFTRLEDMKRLRASAGAATMSNGQVLLAGAWWTQSDGHTYGDLLDPAAGAFQETGALNTPRSSPLVLPTADGRALVLGGMGYQGNPGFFEMLELFDPASRSFARARDSLFAEDPGWNPGAASSYGRVMEEQKLSDGRFLFLASRGTEYRLYTVNPATLQVSPLATTPALPDATSASLWAPVVDAAKGRAYLLGSAGDPTVLKLWVVDLSTGVLTEAKGSFTYPAGQYPYGSAVLRLKDGRILMSGGTNATGGQSNFGAIGTTLFVEVKP
ncbi:MAG TPA: dockerin type I domain-containing protein [Armatimonadota bacterium]|jgi:hypothetical protein